MIQSCRSRQRATILQLAADESQRRIDKLRLELPAKLWHASVQRELARDRAQQSAGMPADSTGSVPGPVSHEHAQQRTNSQAETPSGLPVAALTPAAPAFGCKGPSAEELPSDYMRRTCQATSIPPGAWSGINTRSHAMLAGATCSITLSLPWIETNVRVAS